MSPPASSTSKDSNPPSPKDGAGAASSASAAGQTSEKVDKDEERKFESINKLRAKAREHEQKMEENANKSEWAKLKLSAQHISFKNWDLNFPAKIWRAAFFRNNVQNLDFRIFSSYYALLRLFLAVIFSCKSTH